MICQKRGGKFEKLKLTDLERWSWHRLHISELVNRTPFYKTP